MELNTRQGKEDDTYAHLNHDQQGKEAESKLSGDAVYAQCSQPRDEAVTRVTKITNGQHARRRERITLFILVVSLVLNIAAIAIAVAAYLEANSTSSSAEFAVQSQTGEEENKTSGEFPMPERQPHIRHTLFMVPLGLDPKYPLYTIRE